MDSRYRVAKLWAVFCETGGGAPSLLLHVPVWLVSYVHWSLQHQAHHQEQRDQRGGPKKKLPSVEFRAKHRNTFSEAGWAMQAVTAAAAAVDLNREASQGRATAVARFDPSSEDYHVDEGCGEIRLLDFSVSRAFW